VSGAEHWLRIAHRASGIQFLSLAFASTLGLRASDKPDSPSAG